MNIFAEFSSLPISFKYKYNIMIYFNNLIVEFFSLKYKLDIMLYLNNFNIMNLQRFGL